MKYLKLLFPYIGSLFNHPAHSIFQGTEKCPHKEWDQDCQIKIIKCKACGKTAWLKETKGLFK